MKTYEQFHASDDIARCNAACRIDELALFRSIMLANGSIRIKSGKFWQEIAPRMYVYFQTSGYDIDRTSKNLHNFAAMKFKRDCIEFAYKHRFSIHRAFRLLSEHDFYIWMTKNVPGLGPAKAAFVSQMANGYLGCIDTVNAKRFGFTKKIGTVKQYLKAYASTGESSHEMWYTWCAVVGERDGMNPRKLSKAHAEFVERGQFKPSSL